MAREDSESLAFISQMQDLARATREAAGRSTKASRSIRLADQLETFGARLQRSREVIAGATRISPLAPSWPTECAPARAYPRVACRVPGCDGLRKGWQLVCAACWDKLPIPLQRAVYYVQSVADGRFAVRASLAWLRLERTSSPATAPIKRNASSTRGGPHAH